MQGVTGSTMVGGGLVVSSYADSPLLLCVAFVTFSAGIAIVVGGVFRRRKEARLAGLR